MRLQTCQKAGELAAVGAKEGDVGELIPNYILVGRADKIENQPTLNDCVSSCLKQQEGDFQCKAGHYYWSEEVTQNCILVGQNRFDDTGRFGKELTVRCYC